MAYAIRMPLCRIKVTDECPGPILLNIQIKSQKGWAFNENKTA